ncbi:GFA family protein [Solimonas sp. K1W22B-7]|uniref:GFA family protein n=1 Tax=Solimonas sp. K1W22B-7 TaxID=2303331 RepID=UPI000E32E596|nr:GFA family protein [Solimonas sp. K1W22B-7]AXQ28452.1 GFA family protein [Solimonas sp. K1W22B-7]
MSASLEGRCLCGALRYRITLPVIDAGYCHCRLCQRSAGAPVLAWLTVPMAQFAWLAGTPVVFHSSEHSQREFCGACGTQLLFRRSADPQTVDVTIASLDDPEQLPPQYHIWRQSRIGWFETADSLPRHEDSGPDR